MQIIFIALPLFETGRNTMNNKKRIIEILASEHSFPVQFVKGFFSSFHALKIVNANKKLWLYFIIPFIINLVLLSAIFYFSYNYIYPFILNIIPSGDTWYLSLLRWITGPIVIIILGIICAFLFSISGNIITAPLNDPLSARVEELLSSRKFNDKFSLPEIWRDIIRILKNTIKLLILLILFNLVILLFNIVPALGSLIYSILGFLSMLFFLGFSFFDFPLERRKLNFNQKLRIVWKFKFLCMGLGLSFIVLSVIPILGFLALNLATIGAAYIFVTCIDPNLKIEA